MARGPKKHLKRISAPSHWLLDKLSGIYAPRPSQGPHALRECLPISLLLRDRLKLCLSYAETHLVCHSRSVFVDGKSRVDRKFPLGLMDVVSLPALPSTVNVGSPLGRTYRILLDTKGRLVPIEVDPAVEGSFKLCKVKSLSLGPKGIPQIVTHDGRTLRFPHPNVRPNDTVIVHFAGEQSNVQGAVGGAKATGYIKFQMGALAMVSGGHNKGRIGRIVQRDVQTGEAGQAEDVIHIEDARGERFATLISNVFVIAGAGEEPSIAIPKMKGIKLDNDEDRTLRLKKLEQ